MSAGGGSESSKAGGLNDGARSRSIGRCIASGPPICAVGGLARPADCTDGNVGRSDSPVRFVFNELRVGTNEVGEFRRLAAPGHPHS